jgi:hypothetical protein
MIRLKAFRLYSTTHSSTSFLAELFFFPHGAAYLRELKSRDTIAQNRYIFVTFI